MMQKHMFLMNWKNAEQADRIRHLEEQAEQLTNKIKLLEKEKEEAEKQKLEAGKTTNILSFSVCRGGTNREIPCRASCSQLIDRAAIFRTLAVLMIGLIKKMAQLIWNNQLTLISGPWHSIGQVSQIGFCAPNTWCVRVRSGARSTPICVCKAQLSELHYTSVCFVVWL